MDNPYEFNQISKEYQYVNNLESLRSKPSLRIRQLTDEAIRQQRTGCFSRRKGGIAMTDYLLVY
jgi:hypothetical protein